MNAAFEIGGHKGIITSVRAVEIDSQHLPFPELRQDRSINRGYEFTVQSLDPAVQWNVLVSLARLAGSTDFVDCIGYLASEAGAITTHTVTCRGLPNSILEASVYEVSILMDGIWELDWRLPAR